MMKKNPLIGLKELGQSLWLDNITRGLPIKSWIEQTVSLAAFRSW